MFSRSLIYTCISFITINVFCYLQRLSVSPIPNPDGQLHFYFLPIGQGDATVIQCPGGQLGIYDMGSRSAANSRFWHAAQLQGFLSGRTHDIRSIVMTHNDTDHYNLLPKTLTPGMDLSGLQNIYISCTEIRMNRTIKD